jgi:hypothetical protein
MVEFIVLLLAQRRVCVCSWEQSDLAEESGHHPRGQSGRTKDPLNSLEMGAKFPDRGSAVVRGDHSMS